MIVPSARKKKVSRIERQFAAVVFDWKGTIAVKRKKHHKRKKWGAVGQKAESAKDQREVESIRVLQTEVSKVSKVSNVEGMLEEAEKEYVDYRASKGKGYTTIDFLRWFLTNKVGLKSGELIDHIVDAYMDEFLHRKWFEHPPEIYPGAVEVLRRLKKEGVKTALLRNCSLHAKAQRKILSYHGFDDLFDVIVSVGEWDQEDRGPSKRGYRDIITKLDMDDLYEKHPEKILFVGNSTADDIKGGNSMGWQTCLITTTEPTSGGLATYEVDSWIQLANDVIWPRKFIKKQPGDRASVNLNKETSFEDSLKPITEQNLGINPFIQAVAGHRWQEGKQGFLKGGDRVYKPLPAEDAKGSKEADFYQIVAEVGPQHFPFVPRFYGVRNFVVKSAVPEVSPEGVEISTRVLPHLVLADVTAPFDEPSVLDVKIGMTTYDPNTSDLEKIESQKKKYPFQGEMGYSVAGMRVYFPSEKRYESRDRQWGRALRRQEAHLVFETFFWNGQTFQIEAAKDVMEELLRIKEWMSKQTTHKFYSSSLLIIYEGDSVADPETQRQIQDESETDEATNDSVVRMIDFPHVVPSKAKEVDRNYLDGLELLIGDLNSFIEKHK